MKTLGEMLRFNIVSGMKLETTAGNIRYENSCPIHSDNGGEPIVLHIINLFP